MKALLILLMLVPLAAIAQKETDHSTPVRSGEITRVGEDAGIQPDSIAPDTIGIRNLTSVELSKEMIPIQIRHMK